MEYSDIIILGALVACSIAMILYSMWPAKKEQRDHVLRRMAGKRAEAEMALKKNAKGGGTAQKMLDKFAPIAMRPVMPKSDAEMTTLREKLANAGFRQDSATKYFLASKTFIGGLAAVVAGSIAWTKGYDMQHFIGILAFSGGVAFMLPNLWLKLAMSQRMEKVRNGLPDCLDLLVVSVESGLALDAGIQRVSDEMHKVHKDLAEELTIATLETQMGVPRGEALVNMSRRCGVEEMKALVAVVTQAEKFGTSVAKALRNQADALRVKRRQRAEERAQKTTVKLMIPLILFIFPSIFVVLVGPAALRIYEVMDGQGLRK
jgi:tight adherence protein C